MLWGGEQTGAHEYQWGGKGVGESSVAPKPLQVSCYVGRIFMDRVKVTHEGHFAKAFA